MNLRELTDKGVLLSLVGDDKISVSVPTDINTPELKQEIVAHKPQLIEELRLQEERAFMVLERWRVDSIPQWQKALGESIEEGDITRKAYAEYMLNDVLK